MKKILNIFFISSAILLSGCFGGDAADENIEQKIEGFRLFQTSEFSLQVPEEWEILTPDHFTSDIPKSMLAAFRSNLKDPVFTPNIAIFKHTLSAEAKSLDYIQILREKNGASLQSYKELGASEHTIKVADKDNKTIILSIEGREKPDSDLKQFIETAGVKGADAYLVLGAFLDSQKDTLQEKIETSVKSFRVK